MPDNPLLGLMGYSGPVDDQGLLQMASEWPPRWWKRLIGTDTPILPANRAAPPTVITPEGRAVRRTSPQQILLTQGYLPQQRSGNYNEELSRRAFETVNPFSGTTGLNYYEMSPIERVHAAEALVRGGHKRVIGRSNLASEDAWAMYLGLPQVAHTFEVSPYKPTRSTNPHQVYLRIPTLWSAIENGGLYSHDGTTVEGPTEPSDTPLSTQGVRRILQFLGNSQQRVVSGDGLGGYGANQSIQPGTALADFKLGRGSDAHGPYISAYDIWDLDAPGAGTKLGRSFEIYDRVYYDPRTYEPRHR